MIDRCDVRVYHKGEEIAGYDTIVEVPAVGDSVFFDDKYYTVESREFTVPNHRIGVNQPQIVELNVKETGSYGD